jgi:starch synthase
VKILYVASEAYPLIKTGGLGDVAGSLPPALQALGHEVRLLLPAYRDVLERVRGRVHTRAHLGLHEAKVRILETTLPDTALPVWLVDAPACFDRPGNPYLDPQGKPWTDNAQRFAVLARAAVAVAQNRAGLDWRPDLVHTNDWQTGLIPALLSLETQRPRQVFTIHNLAYQGLFPARTFGELALPPFLASMHALEFHGQLSFIKGGLVFADHITTVSPTYAREIQTAEYGCGLEGVLQARSAHLSGILNGIDTRTWDPATDPHLPHRYDARSLEARRRNKARLQRDTGLEPSPRPTLVGMVGRLVEQKGIDVVLEALPRLLRWPLQFVILGSGESRFEEALSRMASRHPRRMAVHIGYDEALAHRIEGSADVFLMPSRFEPCGLNQMYSLRYGALPVVRATGGLADTVVDATPDRIAERAADGFSFTPLTVEALLHALDRAHCTRRSPRLWQVLQRTGMAQDFSWERSAREYAALYARLLDASPDA